MTDALYTASTIEVRDSSDGERYDFGVTIEGVFVPMFSRKKGGLDDAIAREKSAAKEREQAAFDERARADQAARDQAAAEAAAQSQQQQTPPPAAPPAQ